MTMNPFPGPQPYRAADRKRFHGREDLSHELESAILANRCITVHGPSGAGKSSLVQASVVPRLEDVHDIRHVRVVQWPEGQSPIAWLASAMYGALKLGEVPADISPADAVFAAARRAARGSPRILLVYLDQIEELLYPGRDAAETEQFLECLNDLVELPLRTLRVVLSLREDYLGRLRDRLRDRRRLLDSGFRVGPMTVAEIAAAVCLAAASGDPPQQWSEEPMRILMRSVRVPGQAPTDDAEAQSAYAQIVCRALFAERAAGRGEMSAEVEAEPILRHYIDATLAELGPLRDTAQRLLEDHLVATDGSRTLRTEKELLRVVGADDLTPILHALEAAAILHAEEHQGSRYFEIGHDWLARWVFEQRQARQAQAEQRRRAQEQRIAIEKARRGRRISFAIAAGSLFVAAAMGPLGLWAFRKKVEADIARKLAQDNEALAEERRSEAHDASILAGYRELSVKGKLALALKLLPEVDFPAKRRGWIELASEALNESALRFSLEGHTGPLSAAEWSPDGKRILTASTDGTARIWSADGPVAPLVLKGPAASITDAAWSHDGKRIVLVAANGEAHVMDAAAGAGSVIQKGDGDALLSAAFSADDARILTLSEAGVARILPAAGNGVPSELRVPRVRQTCAAFDSGGARVFTGADDGAVRRWDGRPKGKTEVLGKHTKAVVFLAVSPGGKTLVSTSADGTAKLFRTDGNGPLPGPEIRHDGAVNHAAWRSDGKYVATASTDRTARITSIDGSQEPVVLEGHTQSVTHVSFRPDGLFVATASLDATARVFPIGGGAPLMLRGHDAPIASIAWSPDGGALVTAASDRSDRGGDRTAKVWSADPLRSMRRGVRGKDIVHAGFIGGGGSVFVTASDDGVARLFRIGAEEHPATYQGHEGWLTSAAISPAGDRLVTTSFDHTARVWSANGTGAPIVLSDHGGDVRFAVFSPDGTRVLTGADDDKARIFPADGKGAPVVLSGHEDWLTAGAWSADGKQIVTASLDGSARVWNAEGGGASRMLSGHDGEVLAVAFFPKDTRILTGSSDATARVWKQDGGSATLVHDAAVTSVTVSTDGSRFATSSADRTIRIWRSDLQGAPIVLTSPVPVLSMTFIHDDQEILALGQDGTTRAWMLDAEAIVSRLWKANAECLSVDMRRLYLGESPESATVRYEACKKMPMTPPNRATSLEREKEQAGSEPSAALAPAPARAQTGWKPLEKDRMRVKVLVLPADADVELAGTSVARRNGVIELAGKAGETFTLRVQKGTRFGEYPVTITAGGASPAKIDATETKAATPAAEGEFDALMPDLLK